MWGKVIPDDYVVHFSDCDAAEDAGLYLCGYCCSNFRDIKDVK